MPFNTSMEYLKSKITHHYESDTPLHTKLRHIENTLLCLYFETYEELGALLKYYFGISKTRYHVKNSESLENYFHRTQADIGDLNTVVKNLRYQKINLACCHGTQTRKPNTLKNTSTIKHNCPAAINIRYAQDKCALCIKNLSLKHVDICSKTVIKPLISEEDYEMIIQSVKTGSKVPKLALNIANKYDYPFTPKDIHNIIKKVDNDVDIDVAVDFLKSKGNLKIIKDAKQTSIGYLYQDKKMENDWSIYGQFLIMDSTFKVIDKSWSLFALVGVDNNKKTTMFSWFLLANETYSLLYQAFSWFLHNNNRNINRSYITDKDFAERKVLTEFLPKSKRYLCRFHVLKFWKNYITISRFAISKEQRADNLDSLKKIIYVQSTQEYSNLVDGLTPTVRSYFKRNWDGIKHEYIAYFKDEEMIMGIHTSNNAESFFSSLKKYIRLKNTTGKFMLEMHDFIKSKRNLKKRMTLTESQKLPGICNNTPIACFRNDLSCFSYKIFLSSFYKAKEYGFTCKHEIHELNKCCRFRYSYMLPCRHVVSFWMNNQQTKLIEFIHPRWLAREKMHIYELKNNNTPGKEHKLENQTTFFQEKIPKRMNFSITAHDNIVTSTRHKQSKGISELERFKKLRHLTDRIASILSADRDVDFRICLLEYLIKDLEEKGLAEFSKKKMNLG